MAVLRVARMGNPILRQIAEPVPQTIIETREFQSFIDDMIETMREYDGVGLAAPQVRRSIRVSVVEYGPEEIQEEKKNQLYVFVNPILETLTDETAGAWEGCLSIPGLRGLVKRPAKVGVQYLDRLGKAHSMIAQGYFATVLQHEFDHLDGKLYIDRLANSEKLVFEEEFQKYWTPKETSREAAP